jgi:hypothetical protein
LRLRLPLPLRESARAVQRGSAGTITVLIGCTLIPAG